MEAKSESHQSQERALRAQIVEIEPGVSNHQLHSLKMACRLMDISYEYIENAHSFIDLYELIEHKMPQRAPSFVYQVLLRVGFPKRSLRELHRFVTVEVHIEENIILDLVLTVAFLLGEMDIKCYEQFKEIARKTFLPEYHQTRILSPCHLLELLLDKGVISLENLNYLFAWFEAVGCEKYHDHLRQYCTRHRIPEPDWSHLRIPFNITYCFADATRLNTEMEETVSFKGDDNSFMLVSVGNIQNGNAFPIKETIFCTRKCSTYSTLLLLLPLILTVILFIAFSVIFHLNAAKKPDQVVISNSSSLGHAGANSTVFIKPNCYDSLSTEKVVIHSNRFTNALIYKGHHDTLQYRTYSFVKNDRLTDYKSFQDDRFPLNYIIGDAPVYTAGNGSLIYIISAMVNGNFSFIFKFCLFDSLNDYRTMIGRGHIANTLQCHQINKTVNEKVFDFFLNDTGFYYVAAAVSIENVLINVSVHGSLTIVDTDGLEQQNCTLSEDNFNCTVSIFELDSNELTCVFIDSNILSEVNVTLDVTTRDKVPVALKNLDGLILMSFAIITFCCSVCLFTSVVIYAFWRYRKFKRESDRYNVL